MGTTKAYRDTSVSWTQSQGQITKLLNQNEIYDIQFTTISHATAEQSGLTMEPGTTAIMIVFQKEITMQDSRSGRIPVRLIVPNVPPDNKGMNQHYRLIY